MDIQFWLYVIIAVVIFLSRILKKTDTGPNKDVPKYRPENRADTNKPTSQRPKQLTFEELLREITEAKQAQTPEYHSQPKREYVDYDEEIEDEEKSLEKVKYADKHRDGQYEAYEKAKREAFERPSLEESMNVRDTNVEFGKFKVFEQEKKRNLLEEYTKDFKDPEGLKKAIVISEVLNRKF